MIPDDGGLPKRVGSFIIKYSFDILSQYFMYFPTRLRRAVKFQFTFHVLSLIHSSASFARYSYVSFTSNSASIIVPPIHIVFLLHNRCTI
jgi:hypothetical protein